MAALIAVQISNLGDAVAQQKMICGKVRQERRKMQDRSARVLYDRLPGDLKRSVDLAQQEGSPSWLESLPLSEHGYHLSKSEFCDAICLRYSWSLDRPPTRCVCGAGFSIEHALSCPCEGYPSLRHNEVRDLLAGLMSEVAH